MLQDQNDKVGMYHTCLRNKVWKSNKEQTDDKLNELIDRFAKIHNNEQLNKIEMERKDTKPKVLQPAENMDTVHK